METWLWYLCSLEDGNARLLYIARSQEWQNLTPLAVARVVLRRVVCAAASISGANSDLATIGVRWAKAALGVVVPALDESDVAAGFHRVRSLVFDCLVFFCGKLIMCANSD